MDGGDRFRRRDARGKDSKSEAESSQNLDWRQNQIRLLPEASRFGDILFWQQRRVDDVSDLDAAFWLA